MIDSCENKKVNSANISGSEFATKKRESHEDETQSPQLVTQ